MPTNFICILMYASSFFLNGLSHLGTIYLPQANTLVASPLLSILLIQLIFQCMSRSVLNSNVLYSLASQRHISIIYNLWRLVTSHFNDQYVFNELPECYNKWYDMTHFWGKVTEALLSHANSGLMSTGYCTVKYRVKMLNTFGIGGVGGKASKNGGKCILACIIIGQKNV